MISQVWAVLYVIILCIIVSTTKQEIYDFALEMKFIIANGNVSFFTLTGFIWLGQYRLYLLYEFFQMNWVVRSKEN